MQPAATCLQGDGGAARAGVLLAGDEAQHVALDGDGGAVHELRAQLIQYRHLSRPQEHLRLAQLVALRACVGFKV